MHVVRRSSSNKEERLAICRLLEVNYNNQPINHSIRHIVAKTCTEKFVVRVLVYSTEVHGKEYIRILITFLQVEFACVCRICSLAN